MKSMKEIAEELNVTKMTVYNNAKKVNVKFQKINNVNYLSSEDEIIVVNKIRKNQNKKYDFESEKKEDKSNNDSLVKDETIKQLYNQIDIYKEQSNRDKEQINTLNRLLENQQVLALESNKKIQKLENQLEEERKLKYTFDSSNKGRKNVNKQEANFTEPFRGNDSQKVQSTDIQHKENKLLDKKFKEKEDREKQVSKKGVWKRLFGK